MHVQYHLDVIYSLGGDTHTAQKEINLKKLITCQPAASARLVLQCLTRKMILKKPVFQVGCHQTSG